MKITRCSLTRALAITACNSRSPGINAGLLRDWMTGAIDLDGNPRIRNHFVDMGRYEGLLGGTIFSVR